ncbi:Aspartic proteinase sxa1 [Taphrina deformans PYCC 5710]|uniref:Aspartic proteinase sxa1 n=1 Tax=Taphrina deformans (strain PYCC 5710 / ATCC 11124 / CBS 356.35 / IMI 108563 / JCM 9778 / NBRC 8474) TaxID=1097556 RepID=R4XBT1_TAPDE|nr:Aspartic proteinase sxa1 [Taphrina deformans PYCC 5710]|eukprot:CCG83030.1 Aspartic proteinase sxa1 [Taphrina deformans PYCC 5710]
MLLAQLLLVSSVAASKVIPHYSPALLPDDQAAASSDDTGLSTASKRGWIELPIQRANVPQLHRRATGPATAPLAITNDAAGYTAAIRFGTPAQTLNLILDTGSPLTWAASTNISAFTPSGGTAGETTAALEKEICTSKGCYNPGSSSTYADTPAQVFAISYVDTSEAVGEIISETASFAGLSVPNFEFGLATYQYNPSSSGAVAGIIGLGPAVTLDGFPSVADAISAMANSTETPFTSPTLLDQFVAAKVIASSAFSLYLDAEGNGSVILGGVDAARYSGPLTVVPIVEPADRSLQVTLLSVGFNGSTAAASTASVDNIVVLDSGTTVVYLPTNVVSLIASSLGGTVQGSQPVVPCSAITATTTIDFHFQNGATIRTPVELLVDAVGRSKGQQVCQIGVVGVSSDAYFLLGDYFLRSAYVVYNWDQQQIALAQVRYADTGSSGGGGNISAITTGTFGIPNAVYNASSPGASGVANVATVSGTSQPWSAASTTASSAAAATGLTLSLTLLAALLAASFILT